MTVLFKVIINYYARSRDFTEKERVSIAHKSYSKSHESSQHLPASSFKLADCEATSSGSMVCLHDYRQLFPHVLSLQMQTQRMVLRYDMLELFSCKGRRRLLWLCCCDRYTSHVLLETNHLSTPYGHLHQADEAFHILEDSQRQNKAKASQRDSRVSNDDSEYGNKDIRSSLSHT